jgi:cytochrome c
MSTHPHTPPRTILTAVALAAGLTASAFAATPTVGTQHVQEGGTFPVDVAGQHPAVRAGDALRHGQRLISRKVTLGHGKHVTVTLTCPSGTVQRGLATGSSTAVSFNVAKGQHYPGARTVRVDADGRAPVGQAGSGHVYGLCS